MLLYSEPLNSQHTFMSGPRAGCSTSRGLHQTIATPQSQASTVIRNTGQSWAYQDLRGLKQWLQIKTKQIIPKCKMTLHHSMVNTSMLYSGKVFSWCLYEFPRPALTKHYKLGSLKQQEFVVLIPTSLKLSCWQGWLWGHWGKSLS